MKTSTKKSRIVKTLRAWQRCNMKRIDSKFVFPKRVPVTHGKFTVTVIARETKHSDRWWREATIWHLIINGRRLAVESYYRPKLPKTYGFVARCALAKAVKAAGW